MILGLDAAYPMAMRHFSWVEMRVDGGTNNAQGFHPPPRCWLLFFWLLLGPAVNVNPTSPTFPTAPHVALLSFNAG